jgi:hypothetical protein
VVKEVAKKKPKVKTIEDKGTKIDFVDFGDGNYTVLFREEKFRGLDLSVVKLGWSEKYKVVSPREITKGTLSTLSEKVKQVSGLQITPEDLEIEIKLVKKKEKK